MIENTYAKVTSEDGWQSSHGFLKPGSILKVGTILASPYSSAFQAEGFGTEFFPEKPFTLLFVKVGSEVFYDKEQPMPIHHGFTLQRGMKFKIVELKYDKAACSIRIKLNSPTDIWLNLNDFRVLL